MTEEKALSLYSNLRDMLTRERKRLKDLRLEDDYKSDGSEAREIRKAITIYTDRLTAATASVSFIGTEVHNPTVLTTASMSSIGTEVHRHAVPITTEGIRSIGIASSGH